MKITAVKTYLLEHPFSRPIGPAIFYYRSRQTLVIKLETDADICGWGETAAFDGLRGSIEERYARALIGRDPTRHRGLWRELCGPNFGQGPALGGIDIALDDLRGKALGLSIGDLYGGALRSHVTAYASAMDYIEGEDPAEQFPCEAAKLVDQGFKAVKLRIGGQPMEKDLAAVAAVRRTIGAGVRLMADGNGAYTVGSALRMGRELERLGLQWFEEPLPQNTPDYAGYEVLTDKLDLSIAAGECLISRGMFKEAIARRAMDIVQPDVGLAGGIGECLFVAELARLWGIQCMPHCWAGPIGMAATLHLVSLLPDSTWARHTEEPMLELDAGENQFRDTLLAEPLEVRGGLVVVPKGPGLGIQVDEERLAKFSVP